MRFAHRLNLLKMLSGNVPMMAMMSRQTELMKTVSLRRCQARLICRAALAGVEVNRPGSGSPSVIFVAMKPGTTVMTWIFFEKSRFRSPLK